MPMSLQVFLWKRDSALCIHTHTLGGRSEKRKTIGVTKSSLGKWIFFLQKISTISSFGGLALWCRRISLLKSVARWRGMANVWGVASHFERTFQPFSNRSVQVGWTNDAWFHLSLLSLAISLRVASNVSRFTVISQWDISKGTTLEWQLLKNQLSLKCDMLPIWWLPSGRGICPLCINLKALCAAVLPDTMVLGNYQSLSYRPFIVSDHQERESGLNRNVSPGRHKNRVCKCALSLLLLVSPSQQLDSLSVVNLWFGRPNGAINLAKGIIFMTFGPLLCDETPNRDNWLASLACSTVGTLST